VGIRKTLIGAFAVSSLVAMSTTADAGFDISISSGLGGTLWADSSSLAEGSLSESNVTLSNGIFVNSIAGDWRNFVAGGGPGGGGAPDGVFVSMDFVITNNTAVDQVLIMSATSAVANPFLGGVSMNGSIGFETLGDLNTFGNGASTNGLSPFYTAFVDNNSVRTLVDNYAPQPFLSQTDEEFGVPIKEVGPGQALTDISMDIEFLIPAGANLSLTATFNIVPVPAPAGIALLGLAGLVTRGRRRKA
jgi:hypothetical protein